MYSPPIVISEESVVIKKEIQDTLINYVSCIVNNLYTTFKYNLLTNKNIIIYSSLMYRSICIVYYLLYTINKETTHYSHYIMY